MIIELSSIGSAKSIVVYVSFRISFSLMTNKDENVISNGRVRSRTRWICFTSGRQRRKDKTIVNTISVL